MPRAVRAWLMSASRRASKVERVGVLVVAPACEARGTPMTPLNTTAATTTDPARFKVRVTNDMTASVWWVTSPIGLVPELLDETYRDKTDRFFRQFRRNGEGVR